MSGGQVTFWGYDPKTGDWSDPAVKVKDRAAANPKAYRGPHGKAKATYAAESSASSSGAGAFLCSLFVSDARPGINWNTVAQCTGSFDGFYVATQLQRDSWLGWRPKTGVMQTAFTHLWEQTYTFWSACNPAGGKYNYRAFGYQNTLDYSGNWHAGPLVYSGGNYRAYCGT